MKTNYSISVRRLFGFVFALILLSAVNFLPERSLAQGGRVDGMNTTTFTAPFVSIVGTPNSVSTGSWNGCYNCSSSFLMPFAFNFISTARAMLDWAAAS